MNGVGTNMHGLGYLEAGAIVVNDGMTGWVAVIAFG
jgi:hypothetical protein